MRKFFFVLALLIAFGNDALFAQADFPRPRGIYALDSGQGTYREANIRDYPFVTGYCLRPSWSELEPAKDVYDFTMIDAVIRKLEPIGKKLSLEVMRPPEPAYIAQTAGVATWFDTHKGLNMILAEFDGSKNPRLGFFQENLAASKDTVTGVITGFPKTNFATPLSSSKDRTFTMFQMLQSWNNPFGDPAKTANTIPADAIKYAYETYGCAYFEIYVADLDDQDYWPSFQAWHDTLTKSPTTSVSDDRSAAPNKFVLQQNYPNPFNPNTVISFQLPVNGHVTLKVFDVLGKEVATLVDNEVLTAGQHVRSWEAKNAASGVYFYRITAGDFHETKKMILTK